MCCLSRTIETEADTSKLCASQWSIEGGKRLGEIAGIGQEMIGAAVARDDLQRITELRMQRWFAASDGDVVITQRSSFGQNLVEQLQRQKQIFVLGAATVDITEAMRAV